MRITFAKLLSYKLLFLYSQHSYTQRIQRQCPGIQILVIW